MAPRWSVLNRRAADTAGDDREAELRESLGQHADTVELLYERLAELELAIEDEGWTRLGLDGEREFTRDGLKRICALSRLMWLKNPLVQRGVNVRTYYTWAQGVQISAPTVEVNAVLQRFLDDRGNRAEMFGHASRRRKDVDLQVDGNLFFTFFSNRVTGHVRVRSIHVDEVVDIHTNPDDRAEPWFYERHWTTPTPSRFGGTVESGIRKTLHPDWRYRPKVRPATYAGLTVEWDAPVYHVRVGGLSGMRFGVPETYAALDWARAYKMFLEDWATLVRSLSKFAWKATTKGRKVSATHQKLGTTLGRDSAETNPPPPAGAAAVLDESTDLAPIPKTGATTSAEDGKQLRLMVAASMDVPDTILSGDVDQGNFATSKTLDRPTELAMLDRQGMWTEILADFAWIVIRSHVEATNGRLSGLVEIDADGIETIRLDGDLDPSVEISFPPILESEAGATIEAIVKAATLDGKPNAGTVDNRTLVRLLLTALGVDDVDELVDELAADLDADAASQVGDDEAAVAAQERFTEALADLREVLTERRTG